MGSTPYNPFYEIEKSWKKTELEFRNAGRDINREWLKIDPVTQQKRATQRMMDEQREAQERLLAQQQEERIKQEERRQRSAASAQVRARQRLLSSSQGRAILPSPIGQIGVGAPRKTLLGS